jgi:hypothetical protein
MTGFLLAHGIDVQAVEFMPLFAIVVLIYSVLIAVEVAAMVEERPVRTPPAPAPHLGRPSAQGR